MSAEIPVSPSYLVTISDDDTESFEKNYALLTIQTRVPSEALESVDLFQPAMAQILRDMTHG